MIYFYNIIINIILIKFNNIYNNHILIFIKNCKNSYFIYSRIRSLGKLNERYYWKGMRNDAENVVCILIHKQN